MGYLSRSKSSAWYIFSALGIYPSTPGTGDFLLHAPKFAQAQIDLGNGKSLQINAEHHRPQQTTFIQNARFQGQPQSKVFLTWEQIQACGKLEFELNAAPQAWGTQFEALPVGLIGKIK